METTLYRNDLYRNLQFPQADLNEIHWRERIHMVCWMNYEESELQPGNNRTTRSKATAADLLAFESLLPKKKKKTILLNLACVQPPPASPRYFPEGGGGGVLYTG